MLSIICFVVQGCQSLRHLTRLSKLEVPRSILKDIIPIKDDDSAIQKYGIELVVQMCREMFDSGLVSTVRIGSAFLCNLNLLTLLVLVLL